MSDEVRERFFDRVAEGWSLAAAAGEAGVAKQSAWEWWRESAPVSLKLMPGKRGGLVDVVLLLDPPPTAGAASDPPTPDRLRRRVLTSEDRAVIAACVRRRAQGDPITLEEIGALIDRDKSVVSREIKRNSGPDGSYHAGLAHHNAVQARKRPKEFRLVANPGLCRRIEAWMDDGWSPKLIATILKRDFPHMIMERVSHETIYQALYVQTRGELRKDLYRQLSTIRPRRKPQGSPKRANSPYKEAFKISQRPAEARDRAVPGHWEGDLVMGVAGGVAVGTLVERSTRFTILLHLPGRHDADSVAAAMIREMADLPEHLRQSLTWDRGTELARYDKIQLDLDMPVYFCDPHSPWQRGTNENTNRLLRHWLTKGTDLSRFTAADLRRIAATLNARPRPTLNLQTPAQALDALLTKPAAA
ncbi:IS30 family transposase [Nocardioides sp.]|uniref:IS30 family transposase n=1 Tax=Nocardioides sp. TaxID=35761 RepID=UPI003783F565